MIFTPARPFPEEPAKPNSTALRLCLFENLPLEIGRKDDLWVTAFWEVSQFKSPQPVYKKPLALAARMTS
jgi:hypothetical protein